MIQSQPLDPAFMRRSVLEAARGMHARGLGRGTSGNVSARTPGGMLVTPSALAYEQMETEDLVALSLAGEVLEGSRKPTTEWRLHAAIYEARPDTAAIVHTHATFCTTLAVLHRELPAFHYMVALAGGDSIRCAPYAPFGSAALAGHAVVALDGRHACFLANHGMVALGATPAAALDLAEEVEHLAELYWRALQAGEPVLLTADEMRDALARFADYR